MPPALILLMTIFTIVKGSAQLQCAAGEAEMIDGTMKCPEPILPLYWQEPLTASEAKRRAALQKSWEIYPYYKNGVLWEEGNTTKLPTCTKNSDCKFADHTSWQYTGICYHAENFWTGKLLKDKFCFIVRKYHISEYYVHPNHIGLKFCSNSVECADSKHKQGLPYDAWHCDKWYGYYNLNREKQSGVCMRAKICDHPDYKFASRPAVGNSCNLTDHSTCKGVGIASVQSSRPFSPKCVQHTQYDDTNLCCQEPVMKCVDGEVRMKDGKFQCDLLVTAAIRIDPGSEIRYADKSDWGFIYRDWHLPTHVLPCYDRYDFYKTDSSKKLPQCTTNADCNFLDSWDERGYCYPAKNAATNLVVKDRMFCFITDGDTYVDPKEIGLKYCESHADCYQQTHFQSLTYNSWMCRKQNNLVDSDYNDRSSICVRHHYCPNSTYFSLTLDGKECNTDESCKSAGLASADTANDYIQSCTSFKWHEQYKMCCQTQLPSCSVGLNVRPRTSCKWDSDCTNLGNHNELFCDTENHICCDLTMHSYLKEISFDRLVALLSNQKKLDRFYSGKSSVLAVEYKREFTLGFDEYAIKAILIAHNEIRNSISNGTFSVRGKMLPAASNMKPLKWNSTFVAYAKTAAIKKCTQDVDNYNIDVPDGYAPSSSFDEPKKYGVKAVSHWENKLIYKTTYTREESDMIAIPHRDSGRSVLRMIYDRVTEVGCSYTRCAGSKPLPTIVACYYGLTADQEKAIDYVYKIAD